MSRNVTCKRAFSVFIVSLFVCACTTTSEVKPIVDFVDPLAPKSSVDDALTSPLNAVTLVTNNPWSTKNFFEKGMGMTCQERGIDVSHAKLWGLDDASDWALASCDRGLQAAAVRVLSSPKAGPEIRSDFNVTRNGILSLGFAIGQGKMQEHSELLRSSLNVDSVDGVTTIDLPTGSGGIYTVEEIHYRGPAHSYILGISRPAGVNSIAPIDPKTHVGGPAYTAVMADDPGAFIDFMKDVMGYEARRDIDFTSSGPGGGLVGIAKGTKMRFAQLFSPGSTSGYVIVLGVGDARKVATADPKPPSQGLAMLSFTTGDLDEVIRRVEQAGLNGLKILTATDGLANPTVSFEAPNGVLIEVEESGK